MISTSGLKRISQGDIIDHFVLAKNLVGDFVIFILQEANKQMVEFQFCDAKDHVMRASQFEEITKKTVCHFDTVRNSISKESIQRRMVMSMMVDTILKNQPMEEWLKMK